MLGIDVAALRNSSSAASKTVSGAGTCAHRQHGSWVTKRLAGGSNDDDKDDNRDG
jgi:hypothetical protein